jgi:hypothetical protein
MVSTGSAAFRAGRASQGRKLAGSQCHRDAFGTTEVAFADQHAEQFAATTASPFVGRPDRKDFVLIAFHLAASRALEVQNGVCL